MEDGKQRVLSVWFFPPRVSEPPVRPRHLSSGCSVVLLGGLKTDVVGVLGTSSGR